MMNLCEMKESKPKKSCFKRKREEYIRSLDYDQAMRYCFGLIPRIPKNDIRKNYAAMFLNVSNACDKDLMEQFADTFCRPDLSFLYHKKHSFDCPCCSLLRGETLPNSFEIRGFDNSIKSWYLSMLMDLNDQVLKSRGIQLIVKADQSAIVKIQFSANFSVINLTKKQEYYSLFQNNSKIQFDSLPLYSTMDESNALSFLYPDLSNHMTISPEFVSPSEIYGTISIYLDRDSKIYFLSCEIDSCLASQGKMIYES